MSNLARAVGRTEYKRTTFRKQRKRKPFKQVDKMGNPCRPHGWKTDGPYEVKAVDVNETHMGKRPHSSHVIWPSFRVRTRLVTYHNTKGFRSWRVKGQSR